MKQRLRTINNKILVTGDSPADVKQHEIYLDIKDGVIQSAIDSNNNSYIKESKPATPTITLVPAANAVVKDKYGNNVTLDSNGIRDWGYDALNQEVGYSNTITDTLSNPDTSTPMIFQLVYNDGESITTSSGTFGYVGNITVESALNNITVTFNITLAGAADQSTYMVTQWKIQAFKIVTT